MWNSKKSAVLSLACTRIVMVLVVVCAVLLPKIMAWYGTYSGNEPGTAAYITLMTVMYCCCVPGGVTLICLDRLLSGIKNGNIFVDRNVRYLRIISWCCFGAAILLIAAGRYYLLFLVVSVVAAFMGLILRVVKNVIEEAILIKRENDFTI